MIKEQVINQMQKANLIEQNETIVVGVSGGPDSICLLHILNEIQPMLHFKIVVAHINHLIREESTQDEQYVENFCEKLKIPVFIKRIDVNKLAETEKLGLEEAGRKARYDFFEEIYNKTNAQKIATAHNKNDLVETMIMNILRGSGLNGLKAIEAKRDNRYIRPLIGITRKEIEEYCNTHNLQPKIDKTNFDNTYTRNKIRNIVIPYLQEEFNPNIINTLSRLSEIVTEEQEYWKKQTEKVYNELLCKQYNNEIILDLRLFNTHEQVIKKKIVLHTISKLMGTTKGIEKIHIDSIIKLCENNIGNKYLTPNKNIKISVGKGKILFTKN